MLESHRKVFLLALLLLLLLSAASHMALQAQYLRQSRYNSRCAVSFLLVKTTDGASVCMRMFVPFSLCQIVVVLTQTSVKI